jgi:hypothetical protein
MAQLAHPNVVTVYDFGTFRSQVYLAMELVEGETLKEWLQREPRSWRDILVTLLEAAQGLMAAHAVSIVHRDFKPANILVSADGRVRVTDFGLARPLGEDALETLEPSLPGGAAAGKRFGAWDLAMTLTATGTVKGTPGYMAPEQLGSDRAIDARADQFSFCVTLYEALYGHRPFQADTMDALTERVLSGRVEPAPPDRVVPAGLHQILLRGLAVAPEDRHPSMGALVAALREQLGPKPHAGARPSGHAARRVLVVAALASIVISGAALRWRAHPAAPGSAVASEPATTQGLPLPAGPAPTPPTPPANASGDRGGRPSAHAVAAKERRARPRTHAKTAGAAASPAVRPPAALPAQPVYDDALKTPSFAAPTAPTR